MLEELIEKRNIIYSELNKIDIEILAMHEESRKKCSKCKLLPSHLDRYYELQKMKQSVYNRLSDVEDEIYLIKPPIKTNGIIDLRRYGDKIDSYYDIYLHNTSEKVGSISYRGYHTHELFGDVGYGIDKKYQGNGYAGMALNMLSEYLNENGIEDFWISCYKNNLASYKTIMKQEDKFVLSENEYSITFQCSTIKEKVK